MTAPLGRAVKTNSHKKRSHWTVNVKKRCELAILKSRAGEVDETGVVEVKAMVMLCKPPEKYMTPKEEESEDGEKCQMDMSHLSEKAQVWEIFF